MLLSIFTEIWPYLVPFISSMLAATTGYWLASRNRAAAETTKQKEAREAAEKAQAGQLSTCVAELAGLKQAFEERKRTADQERTQDKLKFESDLAAVAGILKEFTEAQRLLTGVATNVANQEKRLDRHDTEFDNYNTKLDSIQSHVNQLTISLHRHASQHP